MAVEGEDGICGVAIVGRPIARRLDDGHTLEVTRCCTDGTKNACSMLYAAAARAAKAMGYDRIIGDWTMTKEPHEKELVDACLTIMEYCKVHKRCKGCVFWSNYTLCRMSKAPKRWEIWGVGKVKKNDKTGDSAENSVEKCGENDDDRG